MIHQKKHTFALPVFILVAVLVSLQFALPLEAYSWYWPSDNVVPSHSSKASPASAYYGGKVHMLHIGSSSNNIYHSSYSNDLWSYDVSLSGKSSKAAPAAAVYDGKLHMVHLGGSSNYIYHSYYNGSSWSGDVRVQSQKSKMSPALAAYNGKLHMVHQGNSSNSLYHTYYNGSSWTGNVSIPGQKSKVPAALAEYGGKLHMVHLGDSSNYIYHSYYNGSYWSTNVRIPNQTSKATPALTVFNGKLHMVHLGGNSNDIWHSTYNGSSWTSNVRVPGQRSKAAPALAPQGSGTLHMVHLDSSSNQIRHSLYLQNQSSKPSYHSSAWNTYSHIKNNNNCYNYSLNNRTDSFLQPGELSGGYYSYIDCLDITEHAVDDGITVSSSGYCTSGQTTLALVMAPGWDYHWYRKDSNGRWSHKPGGSSVTNKDNSGNYIYDPRTADRGPYTVFCGFFCTRADDIQGISHEHSPSSGTSKIVAKRKIEKKGIRVTLLLYSGRRNPSFVLEGKEEINMLKGQLTGLRLEQMTEPRLEGGERRKSVIPSTLGYKGILVEPVGGLESFPYKGTAIYNGAVELEGNKKDVQQRAFMADDGRCLEDILIHMAIRKGVVSNAEICHIFE